MEQWKVGRMEEWKRRMSGEGQPLESAENRHLTATDPPPLKSYGGQALLPPFFLRFRRASGAG